MQFTGTHQLYLPQATKLGFVFENIVLNSYALSSVSLDYLFNYGWYDSIDFTLPLLSFQSGLVFNSERLLTTYNTGEPFSVSGWVQGGNVFTDFNGIQTLDANFSGTESPFGSLRIIAPVSGMLSCNVRLYGDEFSYDLNIPDFEAFTNVTGQVGANSYGLIYGSQNLFLQSYENLLDTSGGIVAFHTPSGFPVVFHDNDVSYQDNHIDGVLKLNALFGTAPLTIDTDRYIATGSPWTITGYNSGVVFGNDFDGIWSGSSFTYRDLPSSLTLNYTIGKTNSLGASIDTSVYWSLASINTASGSYVTGFTLATGGQYQQIPTAKFTGYYYVTGVQQSLQEFLFSSGCTGSIPILFSGLGGYGTGASGVFLTQAVLFQDIYTSGINTFYVVTGYSGIGGGTGFSEAPRAIIRTGVYGSTCYDVPRFYGYDLSFFKSANTSGSLAPTAAYLTGIVLYTTGYVSGTGMTGYIVTGLEVTNIGSGYGTVFTPRMSFIRDSSDILTGNASGSFQMRQTGINVLNYLTLEARSGNNPWDFKALLSGTDPLTINDNSFSLRLTISGAPTTYPWTGLVTLKETATSSYAYQEQVVFNHTFSTDTGALKKNDNATGLAFSPTTELSFLLTQSELDTLYAGVEFTNNNQGFDLGDLEF